MGKFFDWQSGVRSAPVGSVEAEKMLEDGVRDRPDALKKAVACSSRVSRTPVTAVSGGERFEPSVGRAPQRFSRARHTLHWPAALSQ
jgi:hypothetical protein